MIDKFRWGESPFPLFKPNPEEIKSITSSINEISDKNLITFTDSVSELLDESTVKEINDTFKEEVEDISTLFSSIYESDNIPPPSTIEDEVGLLNLLNETIILLPKEIQQEALPLLDKAAKVLIKIQQSLLDPKNFESQLKLIIDHLRSEISQVSGEDLHKYGKKEENLIIQTSLLQVLGEKGILEALDLQDIEVPPHKGITSSIIYEFLQKEAPELFDYWNQLKERYATHDSTSPFLDLEETKTTMELIREKITQAFERASEDEEAFSTLDFESKFSPWLEELRNNGDYLIVRSTGAEDFRQAANAGGNESIHYVLPEKSSLCRALGEVVCSYFSYPSLKKRLNAGRNPFEEELKLAVTTQQQIGEPLGGESDPNKIPVSLVMFTNEPLYVGTKKKREEPEKFRVMRICASYGNGEGVVKNNGIPNDTILVLGSKAHPEQLYVLYDNVEKPERLVPIETSKGIVLGKIPNPSELKNRPALDSQMIASLYRWGVIAETYFENPTDMELVIKNKKVYPVQARDRNVPLLLPTYLDKRKVDSLTESPILQKLQTETFLPGQASVLTLSSSEEILVAANLEEAEKKFNKDKHKLILFFERELSSNSHPAVNLSDLEIPCLLIDQKQKEDLLTLLEKISPDTPLLICVQMGTLNLIKEGSKLDDLISKGFTIHPAKVAISLPMKKQVKGFVSSEVPQEVNDLILAIRTATAEGVALERLKGLQEHGWVKRLKQEKQELEKKVNELSIVPKGTKKVLTILDELDKKIDHAFAEAMKSLPNEEKQLEYLFHVKVLESLLFSLPKKGGGLGQYSVLQIEPLSQEAWLLINYQEKLQHPAHFSSLAMMGKMGMTPEIGDDWIKFLSDLEPLVESGKISEEQVSEFKELMKTLKHSELQTSWMSCFFSPTSGKDTETRLEQLLSSLTSQDKTFIQDMEGERTRIQQFRNRLDAFGEPELFEEAWKDLQALMHDFCLDHFAQTLKNSSPLAQMVAQKNMQELVDLVDTAIKTLKASTRWTEEDKVKQFKQTLYPFLSLLTSWASSIVKLESLPYHNEWPLEKYLDKIHSILDLSNTKSPQLRPSHGFSVAAAALGSTTLFERNFPVTLEDIFTLIHQNLLVCISSTNNELFSNLLTSISLPPLVENALSFIPTILSEELQKGKKLGEGESPKMGSVQRLGIELNTHGMEITYNVPLRTHSGGVSLNYDKFTNEMTLTIKLLGSVRTRWPIFAEKAKAYSEMGILPFSAPLRQGDQEIIISWEIKDEKTLRVAIEEFALMANVSLIPDDDPQFLKMLTEPSLVHPQINEYLSTHSSKIFLPIYFKVIEEESDDEKTKQLINNLLLLLNDKEINPDYFDDAIKMLKEFVNKEQWYGEALKLAISLVHSEYSYVRKGVLELFKELFKKNQGYEEAIAIAQSGIKNSNRDIIIEALTLCGELLAYEKGVDEIGDILTKMLRHQDSEIHEAVSKLGKKLGEYYQKV